MFPQSEDELNNEDLGDTLFVNGAIIVQDITIEHLMLIGRIKECAFIT